MAWLRLALGCIGYDLSQPILCLPLPQLRFFSQGHADVMASFFPSLVPHVNVVVSVPAFDMSAAFFNPSVLVARSHVSPPQIGCPRHSTHTPRCKLSAYL